MKRPEASRATAAGGRPALGLLALAIGTFAIGTTEFVVVGLLPELAADLDVSTPAAGFLVTGYALSVALATPFLTAAGRRVPRKAVLAGWLAVFVAANLLAATAQSYEVLLIARVLSAWTHGVFMAIGAVVASELVPQRQQGRAIAAMFAGLTVATVLGVPAGTLVGHELGWRAAFLGIAILGGIALAAVAVLVPPLPHRPPLPLGAQLAVVRRPPLQLALALTAIGWGGQFVALTFLSPYLREQSGIAEAAVAPVLFVFGVAAALGNAVGGWLADRARERALIGTLAGQAATLAAFGALGAIPAPAVALVFVWGVVGFAVLPMLQARVVHAAGDAADVASSLNISAFNLGIAAGALLGGAVTSTGGLAAAPWAASIVILWALLLAVLGSRGQRLEATI
jgi:DHA1 family inner membrane transport protein